MAQKDYNLYLNGVKMPPPAKDGIVEQDQLIWSANAGRTANGNFVGDVIATKKTIAITWNVLTYSDFLTIHNNISKVGRPFITVKYTDSSGTVRSFTGYTEGLTGTIVTYTGKGKVSNVTLNVVQE